MTTTRQQQTLTTASGRRFDITPGAVLGWAQLNYFAVLAANLPGVATQLGRASAARIAMFIRDAEVLLKHSNSARGVADLKGKELGAAFTAYRTNLKRLMGVAYSALREREALEVAFIVSACEAVGDADAEYAALARICRAAFQPRAERAAAPEPVVPAPAAAQEPCGKCAGSGVFFAGYIENGKRVGYEGPCYRCQGKGWQSEADRRRNYGYDKHAFVAA